MSKGTGCVRDVKAECLRRKGRPRAASTPERIDEDIVDVLDWKTVIKECGFITNSWLLGLQHATYAGQALTALQSCAGKIAERVSVARHMLECGDAGQITMAQAIARSSGSAITLEGRRGQELHGKSQGSSA